MGTRGAYGFRLEGKDKVTYNHFDSYPSGLGNDVAKFLKEISSVEELKEIFSNIELVDMDSKPTEKQKAKAKELDLVDLTVSSQSEDDWYCLLRKAQSGLELYKEGLSFMIDSHNFLGDSLFCEWAYIINLDTAQLEVYQGWNKDHNASGRYAALNKGKEYAGIALYTTIPLENLFGKDLDLKYIKEEIDAEEQYSRN